MGLSPDRREEISPLVGANERGDKLERSGGGRGSGPGGDQPGEGALVQVGMDSKWFEVVIAVQDGFSALVMSVLSEVVL